jgi:hypothetical protein
LIPIGITTIRAEKCFRGINGASCYEEKASAALRL